jgi:putative DNA methylase
MAKQLGARRPATVSTEEPGYKRKLIEVALPLEDINREAAREKSIRHGHPSTLHLWWARRPLAAARAVLFAQLVDDPSAHADKYPTLEAQAERREELFDIIRELVKWENSNDEGVLSRARKEIWDSCDGNPPPILDPFAGGGTIPLEAQRLGLEVHASDLNPVAVLINKALIEIPPRWANQPPVFPGAAEQRLDWPAATGLAEDVRRYGRWIRDEAERRIGHLYPKARLPDGSEATVIAWIWARTVTCPNPACGGTMPLVRSFWLGKKKGKERYVEPIPQGKRVRFEIRGPSGTPREGTVGRNGAVCLLCGTPVPLAYIRAEGKADRMGIQLMAIAAEGDRQRVYLQPNDEHTAAADVTRPLDIPQTELPNNPRAFTTPNYGMTRHADLFTNRQLIALTTLCDLIGTAHDQVNKHTASSNREARVYADAVVTYLAMAASKIAENSSSLCRWIPDSSKEGTGGVFSRHAISMIWDFGEANAFRSGPGDYSTATQWLGRALDLLGRGQPATVTQSAAQELSCPMTLISTDPPYYDNVGYADLSDFFYIWLRRCLRRVYPQMFSTLLSPKTQELIADPFRQGGKEESEEFFRNGFEEIFEAMAQNVPTAYPIAVFYAFKQAESSADGDIASTGWQTLLDGMVRAGWTVTATLPIRTERSGRVRDIASNALASSIVLACRVRQPGAGTLDLRGFRAALRAELPDALRELQQGNIAPVDLAQAAIGPGMAVFSRNERVTEPDGSALRVRRALSIINEVLDEVLAEQEGDFDGDTRWCVKWFEQHRWDEGPYGQAETLATSSNTSVAGLERAGVVRARAGKALLLSPEGLPPDYDPETDVRPTVWEATLHLSKRVEEQSIEAAGAFLVKVGRTRVDVDAVRELAYRLYNICDRKKWPQVGLRFNNLVTSWPELVAAAGEARRARPASEQGTLDYEADEDE